MSEGNKSIIPESVKEQIFSFLSDGTNYDAMMLFIKQLKGSIADEIVESVGDPLEANDKLVSKAQYLKGKMDMLKGLASYIMRWKADVNKSIEEENKKHDEKEKDSKD